jgi:hypothetical protein
VSSCEGEITGALGGGSDAHMATSRGNQQCKSSELPELERHGFYFVVD